MKPALSRFLPVLIEKLRQRLIDDPRLKNNDVATEKLNGLLKEFIINENIDDDTAHQFIICFYEIWHVAHSHPSSFGEKENEETIRINSLFKELADNEIYTINLLLHEKNEGHQEIGLSSFTLHFNDFLKCPFTVNLEKGQLQFVLLYDNADTKPGKEQRENGKRFYHALNNLGIAEEWSAPKTDNRFIITIPSAHVRDMLQLAQFELIDEKTVPKKFDELEKKFRYILIELIQTEVSFSNQAGKLAALLAAKQPLENELLEQAKKYYQEIAKNSYPWFGKDTTPEKLQTMSFDFMLELCHKLYEKLQKNTDGKAKEIGKRLGILRWVTVNYSTLNDLINEKDVLKLSGECPKPLSADDRPESEKSIANQYLIPPVQRLPRIILLMNELIKCVNVAAFNQLGNGKIDYFTYLYELKFLNEEWIKIAKRTNELVRHTDQNGSSDIIKRIFQSFTQLKYCQPPDYFSASMLSKSIVSDFAQLRYFVKQSGDNELGDNDTLKDDDTLKIEDSFYDLLTMSVIFVHKQADVPGVSAIESKNPSTKTLESYQEGGLTEEVVVLEKPVIPGTEDVLPTLITEIEEENRPNDISKHPNWVKKTPVPGGLTEKTVSPPSSPSLGGVLIGALVVIGQLSAIICGILAAVTLNLLFLIGPPLGLLLVILAVGLAEMGTKDTPKTKCVDIDHNVVTPSLITENTQPPTTAVTKTSLSPLGSKSPEDTQKKIDPKNVDKPLQNVDKPLHKI